VSRRPGVTTPEELFERDLSRGCGRTDEARVMSRVRADETQVERRCARSAWKSTSASARR